MTSRRVVLGVLLAFMSGCEKPQEVAEPADKLLASLDGIAKKLEGKPGGYVTPGGADAAARIRVLREAVENEGCRWLSGRLFPVIAAIRRRDDDPRGVDALTMRYMALDATAVSVELLDTDGRIVGRSALKQGSSELDCGVKYWAGFVYVTPSYVDSSGPIDAALLKAGQIKGYPLHELPRPGIGLSLRLVGSDGRVSESIPVALEERAETTGNPDITSQCRPLAK